MGIRHWPGTWGYLGTIPGPIWNVSGSLLGQLGVFWTFGVSLRCVAFRAGSVLIMFGDLIILFIVLIHLINVDSCSAGSSVLISILDFVSEIAQIAWVDLEANLTKRGKPLPGEVSLYQANQTFTRTSRLRKFKGLDAGLDIHGKLPISTDQRESERISTNQHKSARISTQSARISTDQYESAHLTPR